MAFGPARHRLRHPQPFSHFRQLTLVGLPLASRLQLRPGSVDVLLHLVELGKLPQGQLDLPPGGPYRRIVRCLYPLKRLERHPAQGQAQLPLGSAPPLDGHDIACAAQPEHADPAFGPLDQVHRVPRIVGGDVVHVVRAGHRVAGEVHERGNDLPLPGPHDLQYPHLGIYRSKTQPVIGWRERETHLHLPVFTHQATVVADPLGRYGTRSHACRHQVRVRQPDGRRHLLGQYVEVRIGERVVLVILQPVAPDLRPEVRVRGTDPHPVFRQPHRLVHEPPGLVYQFCAHADQVARNQGHLLIAI